MQKPSVGILLPAYNEETKIGAVIDGIRKQGFRMIVAVDDGSSDRTSEVARAHGAMVYGHPLNRGAGAAVATGIVALRDKVDIIVMLDADGQHDVRDIGNVIKPILEGRADFVLGTRTLERKSMPRIRRFGNWGMDVYLFLLSGMWIHDTQSGFRAMTAAVARSLELKSDRYEAMSEMFLQLKHKGFRLVEVPIRVIYTRYSLGKGQSVINGIRTAISVLKHFLR
jgi:glycosyltransferase involved in cell wall biosynthesis